MSTGLRLVCPSCAADVFADDEFCEVCGVAVAEPRDRARDHEETDVGTAAGVTDRGLVHGRNDDAMYVAVGGPGGSARTVVVVCDGVSTSAAPQVAAQLAADTIGRSLMAGDSATDAFAGADENVRELSWTEVTGRSAPSCTAVAAIVEQTAIHVAWTGDSRAYWITPERVEQLTVDHSWAQEQIDAGELSAEEAAADRRAHMITRWLGDFGLVDGVDTATLEPRAAGRLVLCSDGLWAHVSMLDLGDLYRAGLARPDGMPPLQFAQQLTEQALVRGGTDNITVVVVDVDDPTSAPTPVPTSIEVTE